MLELIETLLATTSFLNVVDGLEALSMTDVMVVFLLSKPLFIIVALGAIFSGRRRGNAHYLHHRDCDRFLSQSFSSFGPSE